MSARTEKKRKAAPATKRHARKLEQEASRSKVYRGTGTGEWQQIDGIGRWHANRPLLDGVDEDWTRPWIRITNAEQEAWVAAGRQLAAERAIIAATVPAKNYVDRYHRRREWDAYRLTPEYQLRLAELDVKIREQQSRLFQMLGIPYVDSEFDKILAPIIEDAYIGLENTALDPAA